MGLGVRESAEDQQRDDYESAFGQRRCRYVGL